MTLTTMQMTQLRVSNKTANPFSRTQPSTRIHLTIHLAPTHIVATVTNPQHTKDFLLFLRLQMGPSVETTCTVALRKWL